MTVQRPFPEKFKVKETGIVDYVRMCEVMGKIIYERGGQILLGSKVTKIVENEKGVKIQINADQKHMIETTYSGVGFVISAKFRSWGWSQK